MTNAAGKPIGTNWTDEQWNAIALRGQDMLVAAAAGSGKTAVLVERIIRRISDVSDPLDVDRLLVATFTKAAAAEMKERIREALEKELDTNPESQHLRRQLSLMGKASITTLHSLCLEIIERHYSVLGLDPGYRIATETESSLLAQEQLEELLESYYENSADDSAFWQLLDWLGGERNDAALQKQILALYELSRSGPWPEHWLREMAQMFDVPGATSATDDTGAIEAILAPWHSRLMPDIRLELQGAVDQLRLAIFIAEKPGGPLPYLDNLQDDLRQVEFALLSSEHSWSMLHAAFEGISFGRLNPCRGDDYDKSLQEQVQMLRKSAQKQISSLQDEFFSRSQQEFAEEIAALGPALGMLVEIVNQFGYKFQSAKTAKGLLDFSDMEHYALQILRHPDSQPGEVIPSQAALDYQEQFAEVLLDEYQDTNSVQEAIVALISRPHPGNRFMVGDVKQSIYRFRLAEPRLFLEKYKAYSSDGQGAGLKIDLARNFRSRRNIVNAANYIFKQLMDESVAEILYDADAELKFGATYYPELEGEEHICSAEVILIDKDHEAAEASEGDSQPSPSAYNGEDAESGEDLPTDGTAAQVDEEPENAEAEARAIGLQIRKLMGMDATAEPDSESTPPFEVYDKGLKTIRKPVFRDIVILLRSVKGWAPAMIETLQRMGIPAYANVDSGYFSATEVEVMLSLLRIIDNPLQDIPLAAVLRSPIFDLKPDELARIRAAKKRAPYFEAVQTAAEDGESNPDLTEKLNHFLQQLAKWRAEARQSSLADLIHLIYRETGYFDIVGGMPDGQQRQANLNALYDRARQYESTSFRGLFRFLRFIEQMRESGGDLGTAKSIGEQEDVVRIMTIHQSKGLEFPVVFIAGLGKKFNMSDVSGQLLVHRELGFGPRFVDNRLRTAYPTLPQLAVQKRIRLETLAEEMRVLYVALTRPREKMFLVGTVKSAATSLAKWSRHVDRESWLLPAGEISKAQSFIDWLGPMWMRHPGAFPWREKAGVPVGAPLELSEDKSSWRFHIISSRSLAQTDTLSEEEAAKRAEHADRIREWLSTDSQPLDEETRYWLDKLDERWSWQYSYADAHTYFAKTTVSELKRLADNHLPQETISDSEQAGERKSPLGRLSGRRPRFMEERGLTAAERGTVYHAVMQNIPLHEMMSTETINQELERMVSKKLITIAQRETIDANMILSFFDSDIGTRMRTAPNVMREVPFSYVMDAKEAYPQIDESMHDERVMMQGVIDCLFEDSSGLVLLDYKTDAVRGLDDETLRERYRVQLNLYAEAIHQIWHRSVTETYVYYFDGARLIKM